MSTVCCLHPNIHNVDSLIDYLGVKGESFTRDLCWDSVNPSYLFVSEHIYTNAKYWRMFKRYINNMNIIKIYLAGECIAPDLNIFDYALVLDRHFKCDDRVYRFPPRILHRRSILQYENDVSFSSAKEILQSKKGFCSFIYSNWNAHPMRDALFYEISKYKQVSSLGRHLNNSGRKDSRKDENWRELSIELKAAYKFAITAENASYNGYVSEKLLTSLQAHTIPIYWGDPSIGEEYNSEAFIDCSKYKDFEEIIKRIKAIDSNDELWCSIISQPWQTDVQKEKTNLEIEGYYKFLEHIFVQDYQSAFRVPYGTYPQKYRDYVSRGMCFNYFKYSSIGKMIRRACYKKCRNGSFR